MLPNQWYALLESNELKAHKPLALKRLGKKLVFWRDSHGKPHCHVDRCPHLGAALSLGKIKADQLQCPFHGFEFNGEGRCTKIPAHGNNAKIPPGMKLTSYPLQEAHGFIWLWYGPARDSYPELPFFEEIKHEWSYSTHRTVWPAHYSRAIENQLDVAHLAFVHRTTIGAGGNSFVEGPYVTSDHDHLKVWVFNRQDTGEPARTVTELKSSAIQRPPNLEFKFPGTWLLHISPSFKNFIAFVPIDETETMYYLRAYVKGTGWFKKLTGFLASLMNPLVLKQDQRVVITQHPQMTHLNNEDCLIGADRAILQYRKIHARLQKEANESLALPQTPNLLYQENTPC